MNNIWKQNFQEAIQAYVDEGSGQIQMLCNKDLHDLYRSL